ncbi:oxygen-dependent choline dehydrogenase-like [Chironomus tepperi]|uniref:oxygen-dependent choline dehydrogenase-like n=1 Tax=Chironomus tepperi TaxID=113505 RepID=UPI00391F3F5C
MKSEINIVLLTIGLYFRYGNCLVNNTNINSRARRQVGNENLFLFGLDRSHVEESQYYNQYDFIIAGSGPGGCALANRLTKNPKWTVLLIEAGDVETPFQNIPVAAPYLVFSKYNWGYVAEPQKNACTGKKS